MAAPIERVIGEWRQRSDDPSAEFAVDAVLLDRWCAVCDQSRFGLLDGLAAALARGYHAGRLDWRFCDRAVNALVWHLYAEPPADTPDWPDLFWQVYLAFDAGEYRHAELPDADPIEAYTRPLIAGIVERLRLAAAPANGTSSAGGR